MLDEKTIKEINTCPPAKSKAEERYIRKRKLKAFGNSLAFYMCRVFPIKKNLISVCTFEGKGGFGCNPKYIVMELHKQHPEYEIVWFVNKDIFNQKEFPDYVKKVPNTLWSRAYWLTRSKVWIDNYRKPYGTVKRKGQYYLNTWHANEGFKTIGLWRGKAFSKMAYLVSKNDSNMIDDIIVDSDYCAEMFRKGLLYIGEYLKVGQARCDVLYGERLTARKEFRRKYELEENAKVVLFAPTFRETSKDGKRGVFLETWSLDFNRLVKSLETKFSGDWYVCIRIHPQLAEQIRESNEVLCYKKVIDASKDDDMYEILAAVDAYITDYSSAAFDAGFMNIPIFIYADDIAKYSKDRGSLLWNLFDNTEDEVRSNDRIVPTRRTVLPFPVSKNNDEIERKILTFDNEEYLIKLQNMKREFGMINNGSACKKIVGILEKKIGV